LTGVQAFLRSDLEPFCRDAPPEFTEHQRNVFCVFSGQGVTGLRTHLNSLESRGYRAIDPDSDNEDATMTGMHPQHAAPLQVGSQVTLLGNGVANGVDDDDDADADEELEDDAGGVSFNQG
jgi:F-box and leucine-rich repeat protein GRR1